MSQGKKSVGEGVGPCIIEKFWSLMTVERVAKSDSLTAVTERERERERGDTCKEMKKCGAVWEKERKFSQGWRRKD